MSNKTYDIINKIQRWLYSAGILYLALAEIWGLPFADEISKTIMAIGTFLASVLEISTGIYRKNQLEDSAPLDWTDIENELDHDDGWGGQG